MSYLAYTSPGAGYKEAAYPEGGYPPAGGEEQSPEAGRAGAFAETSPYKNYRETPLGGVGPYHVNHFVGYFKLTAAQQQAVTVADFFANFCAIFNPGNEATATLSPYPFGKRATIRFVTNKPLADVHEDWVSIGGAPGTNSFFAKTLIKLWLEPATLLRMNKYLLYLRGLVKLAELTAATPPKSPLAELTDDELKLINQRHFLAGRRSWSIEYSPASGLYSVETAAFERYSHVLYQAMEGPLGLRESVVNLWCTLVANFAKAYGLKLESNQPAGYSALEDANIYYTQAEAKTPAEAHGLPWFADVLKRHPGLSS